MSSSVNVLPQSQNLWLICLNINSIFSINAKITGLNHVSCLPTFAYFPFKYLLQNCSLKCALSQYAECTWLYPFHSKKTRKKNKNVLTNSMSSRLNINDTKLVILRKKNNCASYYIVDKQGNRTWKKTHTSYTNWTTYAKRNWTMTLVGSNRWY